MSAVHLGRARRLGIVLAIAAAFAVGGAFAVGRATAAAPQSAAATPAQVVPGLASSTLPGVSPDALPAYVPGTRWLVVNAWDAQNFSTIGGSTMVTGWPGVNFVYSNPAGTLAIPLNLPLGAAVWQIDAYGYRVTAGSLWWGLTSRDDTTGVYTGLPLVQTTGVGVHHLPASFPGSPVIPGSPLAIRVGTTDANAGLIGVIVQYTLPTNVFVPITPARVYDSRCAGAGGKIAAGGSRTINVKNAYTPSTCALSVTNAIPMGARAVAYNLAITNTNSYSGSVALNPGTSTTVTSSSINWTAPNATLANGGILALGTGSAERQITAVVSAPPGSSTDIVIDITGYFISEG
jgi:hypothetical protein